MHAQRGLELEAHLINAFRVHVPFRPSLGSPAVTLRTLAANAANAFPHRVMDS